ncbi:MAG TPA: metallophosphoesterase family protein [Vicinamibacterales bacterium]|jgi:predicted phosphodiesterase|nr:metallophosphoesterase family protein [Vicinamibacterales bacterium]
MRIAALYDLHGNLPALDAVLADVERAGVDRVVVGGDVLPGPMAVETLERLQSLRVPADFLRGNGDRETLEEHPERPSRVPETAREQLRWCRALLSDAQALAVAAWPLTLRYDVPGVGSVLFCHATPRSDEEVFTHLIPEPLLRPIFDGVADLVVCGHTHVQFDVTVGRTRVVNAGSVGMPFEKPGAYWLLIDPGRSKDLQRRHSVELRRTAYDLEAAAGDVRRTAFPHAEEFASVYLLQPPDMLQTFTQYGLKALQAATDGA